VTDLDEATTWLSQYVLNRGNEAVDVDVYGPATDSGSRRRRPRSRSREPRSRGRRRRGEARAGPRYGPSPRRAPLQWHMWSSPLRESRV
jgi:hypothetical protein